MDIAEQIIIGLAITFIGVVIGAAWQAARRSRVYWGSRRFWKPLLWGKIAIIADKFDPDNAPELEGWEASGLVGGGGMQAALMVVQLLNDLGLQRVGRKASIIYHNEDDKISEALDYNLFCIGGPDANNVTAKVLNHIGYPIPENNGLAPGLQPGRVYDRNGVDAGDGSREALDFGRLIKIQNPNNKDRCVFILWGGSGYGTWAAAKLLHSGQLRSLPRVRQGLDVEIQFRTEISSRVPHGPEITHDKELPSPVPGLAV